MESSSGKKPQYYHHHHNYNNHQPHMARSLTYHHRSTSATAGKPTWRRLLADEPPRQRKPQPVVLYFTSLRGIRRTFEDCRAVRAILRGFRVAVDEKDLSMDSSFRTELQNLLRSYGRYDVSFLVCNISSFSFFMNWIGIKFLLFDELASDDRI